MRNVRLRRLKSDYEAVRRLVRLHPRIDIEGVSGNPPDRYIFALHVKSLRERGDLVVTQREHRLEVKLPLGYPRDAPLCRMLTPVFHPNIAPHAVCIGDHWSASEALDLLIQRVGEMLAYQSYNVKSPLNGRAAQWVDEHPEQVPTDRREFFVDLATAPPIEPDTEHKCANCGATEVALVSCEHGHELCQDCRLHCPACGRILCLACGAPACPEHGMPAA
ncbi:ubiquitin-conjugating enzyme E2 [Haliangium sp.]|uniref:ubiquitin-conjugating enzyme E2 n=1 Tax=Haliangium sp. TaxID=2663208 RepID=UPI003D0EDE55